MPREKDYMLQQCFHCGNEGLLKIVHKHEQRFGGPILDAIGNMIDMKFQEEFEWFLLTCPACQKVTLFQKYTNESYHIPQIDDQLYDEDVLYPQSKLDFSEVPPKIKSSIQKS